MRGPSRNERLNANSDSVLKNMPTGTILMYSVHPNRNNWLGAYFKGVRSSVCRWPYVHALEEDVQILVRRQVWFKIIAAKLSIIESNYIIWDCLPTEIRDRWRGDSRVKRRTSVIDLMRTYWKKILNFGNETSTIENLSLIHISEPTRPY